MVGKKLTTSSEQNVCTILSVEPSPYSPPVTELHFSKWKIVCRWPPLCPPQNCRKYTVRSTGHCLNKCSDSVTSDQLIKLDVVYKAVQRHDCLNSCLYSNSSEKPWILCNNVTLIMSFRVLLGAFCQFLMAVIFFYCLNNVFVMSIFPN